MNANFELIVHALSIITVFSLLSLPAVLIIHLLDKRRLRRSYTRAYLAAKWQGDLIGVRAYRHALREHGWWPIAQ